MTHAKRLVFGFGGVLLIAGAFACGEVGNADALSAGKNSPEGASSSDGGNAGEGRASPSADLGPTDNGVILVHAAGAPSFRLCFKNDLNRQPAPDSELMPQANVVGVEIGGAVRIGPLQGAPGEIYLFSEPLIRPFYPPGQKGPTCGELLSEIPRTLVGDVPENLSRGVHLLVVGGCAKKSPVKTYTTAECGPTYNDDNGNLAITRLELRGTVRRSNSELPAQVIHLSQSLESFRAKQTLRVTFGDLAAPGPHTSIATNPVLGGPPTDFITSPTFDSTDVGVYKRRGFRVAVGDGVTTVAEQSMADVQLLSAPRDVPPSYYSVASNYVFLLLGEPPKADGGVDDERRRLHLLAVPVIEPKPDAGANTDGGSNAPDGGS